MITVVEVYAFTWTSILMDGKTLLGTYVCMEQPGEFRWQQCSLTQAVRKSGTTIKKLRNKMRINIKVTANDASDPAHSCALEFDNFCSDIYCVRGGKESTFCHFCDYVQVNTARETIPLDTSVPKAHPSIIIPSDVPIYPATGLYQSVEPINPARPVPSILRPSHIPDILRYADAGST